jgi:hypothetical protein
VGVGLLLAAAVLGIIGVQRRRSWRRHRR